MSFSPHSGRSVEDVVESQIRRWLAERAANAEEAKKTPEVVPPVVTVSREYGSGGARIARAVAEELGFSLWDHEIVHEIAERTGVREAMLDTLDEHARGALEELFSALKSANDEDRVYAKQLGTVIRSVAHHGSAVVVGRGGQFIVEPEAAFRVRITQPLEERMREIGSRLDVTEQEAKRRIERVERDRKAFCRQHFGQDVTLPEHYDIVINRAGKSVADTVAMIVAAYRATH